MSTNNTPVVQPTARSELFRNLAVLGVAFVTIGYDGIDDSGCIESTEIFDADRKAMELPKGKFEIHVTRSVWNAQRKAYDIEIDTRSVTAEEAIETWCYDLLGEHFEGWGNEDGSFGTIEIDVLKGTAQLTHNARFMTVDTDTFEV